jgi:hypothetical protein
MLNVLLDFTFNRLRFDYLSLNTKIFYKRDNYDSVSKIDMYGTETGGLFSPLPLGFNLKAGYQHLTVPRYLVSSYHDSVFINGTIFVNFDRYGMLGATYQYDAVTKSKFILSYSNNFLSGFWGFNPPIKTNKTIDGHSVERKIDKEGNTARYVGLRFRWGGWRAD